jgi:hypothetical protein
MLTAAVWALISLVGAGFLFIQYVFSRPSRPKAEVLDIRPALRRRQRMQGDGAA